MQTQKMSLANINGKLSRAEMKKIMAGSGDGFSCVCKNGKSAGIADCNNCDKWCKDTHASTKDTCD